MSSKDTENARKESIAPRKRAWSKPVLKESPIVDETANPKTNWRFERTFRRFQAGTPTAS